MITQVRSAYQNAYKNAEYVGLSGDDKADIEILNNGDIFTELDTGNIYIYNEESNNWDLQPKDGGGGGGTAGVSSFKGRTGDVVPLAGDYTSEMVGAASSTDLDTTNQNVTNLSNEIDNIVDGTTKIALPIASSNEVGVVKIGSGVSISADGTISVESGVLPPATADTLGGIKVGSGLSVTGDGTLSATDGITEEEADARYLQLSGGTLTGNLSVGNNKITMGATPTEITDVVNKGYTDGVVKVVSDEVDGIISGATPISIPIATDTKIGGVLQATGVTDATSADDIITQFNALLASLRTSGVLQDNT